MAEQLKLVYQDESVNWDADNPTDIATLDLLPNLLETGYKQAISTDGAPVDDVINLYETGTADDNLATNVQTLDAMLSRVADLKEYNDFKSIWIRRSASGESHPRQACISDIKRSPTVDVTDPFAEESILKQYALGLKREGWWENNKAKHIYTGSPISSLGGKMNYTSLGGDRPARIARTRFGSSAALVEFWAGVQSDRLGETPNNFQPVLNLHLGDARYSPDTANLTDSTAQDGTACSCSFSVDTMAQRVSVAGADLAAGAVQRGRYLVLLRARTTSTCVARVKLNNGFFNPANWTTDSLGAVTSYFRQRISNTNYKLYPIATIDLPANGVVYGGDATLDYVGLGISAEREPGTAGNLVMDCLILIPVLDGMVHVIGDIDVAGTGHRYEVYRTPFGDTIAKNQVYSGSSSAITPIGNLRTEGSVDWKLRQTSAGVYNTVVVAAQRYISSVKADTLDIQLNAYERWVTLRGAAGYAGAGPG
jgi:hypothetical protein